MSRTLPHRHSRHELAMRSAAPLRPCHTLSAFATRTTTANPAMTSTMACAPVVTQLTAIITAKPRQNHFRRGQRPAKTSAESTAHITWKEGERLGGRILGPLQNHHRAEDAIRRERPGRHHEGQREENREHQRHAEERPDGEPAEVAPAGGQQRHEEHHGVGADVEQLGPLDDWQVLFEGKACGDGVRRRSQANECLVQDEPRPQHEQIAGEAFHPRRRAVTLLREAEERLGESPEPGLHVPALVAENQGSTPEHDDRGHQPKSAARLGDHRTSGHGRTEPNVDQPTPAALSRPTVARHDRVPRTGDVDVFTTRRAEPESFVVEVDGDKVRDEGGNRMEELSVTFRLEPPQGEGGDPGLSDNDMQDLARQLNLSETTFITPGGAQVSANVRIFTPNYEMPFAGHPTLGTAYVVRELFGGGDAILLRMPAGDIPVEARRSDLTAMIGLVDPATGSACANLGGWFQVSGAVREVGRGRSRSDGHLHRVPAGDQRRRTIRQDG